MKPRKKPAPKKKKAPEKVGVGASGKKDEPEDDSSDGDSPDDASKN